MLSIEWKHIHCPLPLAVGQQDCLSSGIFAPISYTVAGNPRSLPTFPALIAFRAEPLQSDFIARL